MFKGERMNKDIKILMVALIIIIIGAVSFNYVNITGKTTSDYTTMTISPKLVKAGEMVHITVNPGLQGTYQEIEFYRVHNDLRVGRQLAKICKAAKCFEKTTISYKISDAWDNNDKWDYDIVSKDYYARAYDVYSGIWVKSYLTIERKYEARGPDEHR